MFEAFLCYEGKNVMFTFLDCWLVTFKSLHVCPGGSTWAAFLYILGKIEKTFGWPLNKSSLESMKKYISLILLSNDLNTSSTSGLFFAPVVHLHNQSPI